MTKKDKIPEISEEQAKKVLLLKGNNCSQFMNEVLQDISLLTKPNCKSLTRKNEILPFEDANSLEFLAQKNQCSLFSFVSHSKKRPNNMVLGRLYDGHVLDMIELGIDEKKSIVEFPGDKKGYGSKPLLLFNGDQWENDALYKNIQNIFIDFFRGDKPDKISMKGVDHAICFACHEGKIYMRSFTLNYKNSGNKVPEVVLVPMGPFYDMTVRRSRLPSEDMWKAACQKDKRVKPVKVKNVSRTSLGDKVGRIHMKPQNLDKMGGRRVNVLRNTKKKRPAEGDHSVAKKSKKAKA